MCAELWNIYCLYTTSYNPQMDSMCYPQMNNAEIYEQLHRFLYTHFRISSLSYFNTEEVDTYS